jgi:hypothetical protein
VAAPTVIASSDTEPTLQRPSQVSLAVRLLWISLGLGAVTSAIMRPLFPSTTHTVVTQVATFALLAWLTYKIWVGRNWARVTFVVMTALGLLIYIPILSVYFRFSPVAGTINLLQCLMQLVALYLLFTEPGRGWFKARSPVA